MSENIKRLKDPGSAITHFIGMMMAVLAAAPLIIKAFYGKNSDNLSSFIIFIVSMILLYGASTMYHSFNINARVNKILKKLDHAMIFVLIAGSYTPICLIVLPKNIGLPLLGLIWLIAALGIIFKMFWVTCPLWLSSVMYIAMGWLCVLAFSPLIKNLSGAAFTWLLAGGIIYTIGGVGGVIYALKLPIFNARHKNFGSHEIFHVFVMLGSLCHFILVFDYLA